jgi:DNA-binding LacI/PurR family transcriptional regulator
VHPDNVGGAYAAVSHLAVVGHRRIAFVSTDNLSTTSVAERRQG